MNRKQIGIDEAKGKILREVIFSISDNKSLLAMGEDEFVLLRARRLYDEDAEIQHDPEEVEFYRHDYRREELAKVFDANTMTGFDAEDAKREAPPSV